MRASRSIRNRGKRRKKNVIDLDITSLLDILVIMLVFLLKSYNSNGVVMTIPKTVKLPVSNSLNANTSGVNIQISPDVIWVDDKEVVTLQSMMKFKDRELDHNKRRIVPLYNELVKIKQKIKQVEKSTPEARKFTGFANLIIDKSIQYSFIKKIMYTCAEAGFAKYKFVVLGDE